MKTFCHIVLFCIGFFLSMIGTCGFPPNGIMTAMIGYSIMAILVINLLWIDYTDYKEQTIEKEK